MGGAIRALPTPSIQAGTDSDLRALLQLPGETVPPGVLEDPAIVARLLGRLNGVAGSLLVPALGINDEMRARLPEGKIVQVDPAELGPLFDPGGLARAGVRGASRGAGERLVRHGFRPDVKTSIGMVAYPQSRAVSAVTGTIRGKGPSGALRPAPVLPTTQIVLGHTAIFVKIDGKIVSVRSYATRSLVESIVKFPGISSGTQGVQAEIIDHLTRAPKGGAMFEVPGARSVEYPVSAEVAKDFSSRLPEGGALSSKYTAAPDTAAAKLGKVRLCNGVNCVHWAVGELEDFLQAKVASGAHPDLSLRDVGGRDAARQGKVMGFMTAADGAPVQVPGESGPTKPVFGRPGGAVRLLRWGGRVFMVYDIGLGVYSVWTAPSDQKLQVGLREGGRIGGGLIGAELAVGGCVVFGVATEGLGLLVCGIVGAVGGAAAGEAFGEGLGLILLSPLVAAEFLIEALRWLGEAGPVVSGLLGAPARFLGQAILSTHASLDPSNWDLRYVPADVRADLLGIGYDMWDSLGVAKPDEFLGLLGQPLANYMISARRLERLTSAVNHLMKTNYTVEHFSKMKPTEFVAFWKKNKLHFVIDPDYLAGDDEQHRGSRSLSLYVHPLVARRATINPRNWDISALPVIEDPGAPAILLGNDLITLANIWWAQLGKLPEKEFREQQYRTLAKYSVPRKLSDRLAHGIESAVKASSPDSFYALSFGLPASEFAVIVSQMTPYDFVQFVRSLRVDLRFVRDPASVGGAAMNWVSQGYQPW